jgi:Arc/MetJ-type ribon-helix-helix transcriptional regulator
MSNVQVSEELKQIIDRQVAEGYAASANEYLEAAVRLYVQELEAGDTALAEAAERGLAALRDGDYITIDGPESQRTFWEGVSEQASFRLAAMRATTGDDEHHQPPDGSDSV